MRHWHASQLPIATRRTDARLDDNKNVLWDTWYTKTFFHVKVFNPLAKICPRNIDEAYKYHEYLKNVNTIDV